SAEGRSGASLMTMPYEAPSRCWCSADWRRLRTPAAQAAFALAAEHSPAHLLNHCVRSFFYARAIAAARGLVAGTYYDEETLFLATMLHDIGLTEAGRGPNRFEVDGVFRAARFAREHGLSDAAADLIGDAVALHTSAGTAVHEQPVVALAHRCGRLRVRERGTGLGGARRRALGVPLAGPAGADP
ncbi:HD domain-containing protein, partial [Streptomyces rochei]